MNIFDSNVQPYPTDPSEIQIGDIRSCRYLNFNRLFLISRESYSQTFYHCNLIHPYTEMATDKDIIISKDQWKGTYDLVVQTALSAKIVTTQINNTKIGSIPSKDAQFMYFGICPSQYTVGSSHFVTLYYKEHYETFFAHEYSTISQIQHPYLQLVKTS